MNLNEVFCTDGVFFQTEKLKLHPNHVMLRCSDVPDTFGVVGVISRIIRRNDVPWAVGQILTAPWWEKCSCHHVIIFFSYNQIRENQGKLLHIISDFVMTSLGFELFYMTVQFRDFLLHRKGMKGHLKAKPRPLPIVNMKENKRKKESWSRIQYKFFFTLRYNFTRIATLDESLSCLNL